MKSYEDIFRKALYESFGFIQKLGFSITEYGSCAFDCKNEHCIMEISLDLPPDIFVTIRPREYLEPLKKYYPYHGIELAQISSYYDPNYKHDFQTLKPEEIPQRMRLLSDLFKKHCTGILKGDFSDWPKILDFVASKTKGE